MPLEIWDAHFLIRSTQTFAILTQHVRAYVVLYPQNGDHIVTIDSVTSLYLRLMYC